jgi:hypothetical protein
LDPEALAAVLIHKISLDAYLAEFMAAQDTAESWLRSLMVCCVYHSAQVKQAKLEEADLVFGRLHLARRKRWNKPQKGWG